MEHVMININNAVEVLNATSPELWEMTVKDQVLQGYALVYSSIFAAALTIAFWIIAKVSDSGSEAQCLMFAISIMATLITAILVFITLTNGMGHINNPELHALKEIMRL
jgi:hypothetical protein